MKWDLQKCKSRFIELARAAFTKPANWCDKLGKWPRLFRDSLNLCFRDCLYDSAAYNATLIEAFGADKRIFGQAESGLQESRTMVVVTSTNARTAHPEIFTNYNKSDHTVDKQYGWAQEDSVCRGTKVWEA